MHLAYNLYALRFFLRTYSQTYRIHYFQVNYAALSLINYSLPALLPWKASSIKHLMVFMGSRGKNRLIGGVLFLTAQTIGSVHIIKLARVSQLYSLFTLSVF